ncbi:MAG TPA: peroxiredoxin [Novosphingobium sp.]|nr:peroxiredoxin [Novosphingobium sp.]HZV09399.1 peroxiredoxin [Novosphingobium sp.]
MIRFSTLVRPLALAAAALAPLSAHAELAVGAAAPDFATQGAKGGSTFSFHLAQALKHGPVVLYFYPKAFTQGCTLEAHAFAEAAKDFHRAGATLLGLSADDLPTLKRFSTEECRSAFPVAVAGRPVIAAYDVALKRDGVDTGLTSRTSYVITREGRVAMAYADMDWHEHVTRTLAAVRALRH